MSDPAMEAASAVADAQNRTYLYQDAEAFIKDGVAPDDLPHNRDYQWPHPDYGIADGRRYRATLKLVLEEFYDEETESYQFENGSVDEVLGQTDMC